MLSAENNINKYLVRSKYFLFGKLKKPQLEEMNKTNF